METEFVIALVFVSFLVGFVLGRKFSKPTVVNNYYTKENKNKAENNFKPRKGFLPSKDSGEFTGKSYFVN